ncbi:MAG: crossover junction endodeoxyribonuclease RuvC [Verrucomicrobiales bacterium]|nr:crossover junction endodeoxyribonuclease RuvC [Verrucomicrobiales bacterium]
MAGFHFAASIVVMGISPKQFEALQERTRPGQRKVSKSSTDIDRTTTHEVILGIDPSLRGTGYGVIKVTQPHPETLAQGTIKCPPSWEHSRCLAQIAKTIRSVIRKTRPTGCVVEGIFHAQNLKTAIIMGEARGAALASAGEAGLEIFELAARKVKLAIVGYGGAQKSAVARMVQRMLDLEEEPAPDEADALGLALAYAQENRRYQLQPPKRV